MGCLLPTRHSWFLRSAGRAREFYRLFLLQTMVFGRRGKKAITDCLMKRGGTGTKAMGTLRIEDGFLFIVMKPVVDSFFFLSCILWRRSISYIFPDRYQCIYSILTKRKTSEEFRS